MKTKLMTGITLAAALAGCGNGGNTGAVDDFITNLATAQCAWEFRCCTDAEIMQQEMGKFADQATCVQFAELGLENLHYAEKLAVKQGRITVDSAQATACIAEQQMKMCNSATGMTTPPMMPGTVDPCTLVFKGATAVGDACQFANECVKGAHCVATGAGAEGVCVPYQEEKQICNSNTDCDPTVFNLYCAKQDFSCHLRSPAGGPCAYTIDPTTNMPTTPLKLECDTSTGQLYCDPTSMTCAALPGSGQTCLMQPLPPGVFSQCAQGLVCDTGGTNTCRGPGMVGDDCTRIACDTTLYCDRSVTPNTCKTLPGLGEQCTQNFQCARPYFCNTQTGTPPYLCAQPAQLGESCQTVPCDPTTLYCDTTTTMRTCKSKLPAGSTCTQSNMCLSGFCNFTGATGTCTASTIQVQCIGRM
ncbi:MAG TPA: hypothetical protein VF334_20085 [Polyangia bacterium]